MTTLMNITLIQLALLFCTETSPPLPPTQTANSFCSEQYGFCAKFPSSILPERTPLTEGEGIILKSNDGYSEVTIGAFPKTPGTSTKAIFLSSAKAKSDSGSGPKVVNAIFGEDYYECFFMVGHHYYFHQSYHFEDHFVRVEIKVPLNMPDRMGILRGQMSLDFRTEQKDGKTTGGERAIGSLE